MAFRTQDFKCQDCNSITEILLDTNKPDDDQVECKDCKSKKMERIISVGTGKGSNVTWSKWRV